MIKTIVVDDELIGTDLLCSMLRQFDSAVTLVGTAGSIKEAEQLIQKHEPHLVFIDIRLKDGTAFDLLQKYKSPSFVVVIVSGYQEYALRAFEFAVFDYILKPYDIKRLSTTIMRLLERIKFSGIGTEVMESPFANHVQPVIMHKKLPIHVGSKVMLINEADIMFLKAHDGNTLVRTMQNESYTCGRQLSDFVFLFSSDQLFMRANKTTIVNLNYVSSYTKGQMYMIYMTDGTEIEISRRKKGEMLELLDIKKRRNKEGEAGKEEQ